MQETVSDLIATLAEVDDRGVYFEDTFTSWRDHVGESAAVAAVLRGRLDPNRPQHIGVLLQNTPMHSAVLIAAAISGLVSVGLNPVRSGPALARDLETADCQLVLTDSAMAASLGDIPHILVDSPEWLAEVTAHAGEPLEIRESDDSDLYMLLFTSGTSGNPKAVRCSQGKVVKAALMLAERFGLGPEDKCYVAMPMFHSNAVTVGWAMALACQGSLVLRRKFSASQFMPDVRRYGATYANYVGKPLAYVLARPELEDDADNPLRVVYGNEGGPSDIIRFAKRFDTRVIDGFGSTEGGVLIRRTEDTPATALGPIPEGVAVVDPDTGEPCPVGVTGEMVNLLGAGSFEGYYNNPEADAERMRGGVYHSGDLAFLDEDGYLHFAGRVGDWLRVDGENLGAAPIERALLSHPDVLEVAVYGIPAPDIGDLVMAAAVLVEGAVFDPEEFRNFLASHPDLHRKQWPSYVRVSESLKRTETFKIIKRTLATEGTECADQVWPIPR